MTLSVLREVHQASVEHGADYFVIGATARDILLTHVHGMNTGRATRDVDFAIAVANWEQFASIRQRLGSVEGFSTSDALAHRLHYLAPGAQAPYPIDLVPFGGVEKPRHTIGWPPDMSILMNVAGYEEALAAAISVQVAPGLAVRVASLPGLAVLKLLAWKDRGQRDPKDADDLQFLMRSYASAGNLDRLYEIEFAILEAADHDPDNAGVYLLGKDVGLLAGPEAYAQCTAMLDDPVQRDRLAMHMARTRSNVQEALTIAENMLDCFRQGLDQ